MASFVVVVGCLFVFFVCLFVCFFWGGVWGGVVMFFLKKIFCSFFDGKSVMSALFTYYYV